MGTKQVNMRLDEQILSAFDVWCSEHGITRTGAIEQYMLRQVDSDIARKLITPVPVKVPKEPLLESGAGRAPTTSVKDAVPSNCAHPVGMRIAGTCMVCGKPVK